MINYQYGCDDTVVLTDAVVVVGISRSELFHSAKELLF